MTTITDSIKATLDAQWTAAGGAEPTYYVGEDNTYTNPPPAGKDYIWILSKDLVTDIEPVNDTYATLTHKLVLIANTQTSGDRLKEITDEIERILNSVAITGANYQKITKRDLAPPEYLLAHQELMVVTIKTFLADSGIAYGATATTSFTTDELTVNTWLKLGRTVTAILDEDDMASDDDAALATQQSIKKFCEDEVDTDIATHAAIADAHQTEYTDADAVAAVVAENPLSLTHGLNVPEELDMTGIAATIDMNPAHTAGGNMIDIWPTANQASGTWKGLYINGSALDPSAATTIYGQHIDLSGVNLANNPNIYGTIIQMPATYGGGTEYGLRVTGDGDTVNMCTGQYALELVGTVKTTNGSWYCIVGDHSAYFVLYNPKDTAHPYFNIGADASNYLQYQTWYKVGTQQLHYVHFKTLTASADAEDGFIRFMPDNSETVRFNTAAHATQVVVTGNQSVSGTMDVTGNITTAGTVDGVDIAARDHAESHTVDSHSDTTLTGAYLEDLLMFGSANAAWVPMILNGAWENSYVHSNTGVHYNVGADDMMLDFIIPIPCLKGSLKLYLKAFNYYLHDADADDKITSVSLYGFPTGGGARATIDTDATDHTSTGNKAFSGATFPAAAADVSAYDVVVASFSFLNTGADELDLSNIRMQCYYAT